MKLTGIILAAGESRRMGLPKALLEIRGETFLDRLISTLGAACSAVIVVLGAEAQRIRSGLRNGDRATFVLNPDHPRGQLSSLQCGLAAAPVDAEGVMFMLVDTPAVLPSTVTQIAKRFEERKPNEQIVVPRVEGHHGHPVCVSPEIVQELLGLPYQAQTRDVIHAHVAETVYVDVDDKGVVDDVNDSGGYERLKQRLGTTA